jgi:hypothetical protein
VFLKRICILFLHDLLRLILISSICFFGSIRRPLPLWRVRPRWGGAASPAGHNGLVARGSTPSLSSSSLLSHVVPPPSLPISPESHRRRLTQVTGGGLCRSASCTSSVRTGFLRRRRWGCLPLHHDFLFGDRGVRELAISRSTGGRRPPARRSGLSGRCSQAPLLTPLLHFRPLDLLSIVAHLILPLVFSFCWLLERPCSSVPLVLGRPRPRVLFSDCGRIPRKSMASLQKGRYSPDPGHPCARTDGRDCQATWMRSLALVLARNRR